MAVFQDRVIIVTGASEGIGRAICQALAPQMPRLVLAARNERRLEELKTQLESGGATALVAPTDVSDQVQCRAVGASPMQEDKIMTAEACAAQIVAAMAAHKRLLVTSLRGRVGRWIKLIAPAVVDRIALKAIKEAR